MGLLIDVYVPEDTNISKKEAEKICEDKIEISRMWKIKTSVFQVVVGTLVTITTEFQKYISKLPCKLSPEQIKKITHL